MWPIAHHSSFVQATCSYLQHIEHKFLLLAYHDLHHPMPVCMSTLIRHFTSRDRQTKEDGNESMEDGNELKPKERKTKYKMERCDTKGCKKDMREKAQDQSSWIMKTQCANPGWGKW